MRLEATRLRLSLSTGCARFLHQPMMPMRRVAITYLCTFQRRCAILFAMSKGTSQSPRRSEVLQGTLDLMILKTLEALGPLHGFGIARRIEQAVHEKWAGHQINNVHFIRPKRSMSQIGG